MKTIRKIPAVEVAKLIKGELAIAFPAIKFSVRTRWFGLKQIIVIRWTDRRPTRQQVYDTVNHLSGGRTDGLDDWMQVPITLPSGEKVQLGNSGIIYDQE